LKGEQVGERYRKHGNRLGDKRKYVFHVDWFFVVKTPEGVSAI
jgi:hypothetical protein